jgi:hypothetical protein
MLFEQDTIRGEFDSPSRSSSPHFTLTSAPQRQQRQEIFAIQQSLSFPVMYDIPSQTKNVLVLHVFYFMFKNPKCQYYQELLFSFNLIHEYKTGGAINIEE